MDHAKSFSIDALLGKDNGGGNKESPTRSPRPDSARSGSPGSGRSSSPASPGHHSPYGGLIPRPGLLNLHHPGLGGLPAMFPGHPGLYYPGSQAGQPHHSPPVFSGSAFHLPPDQALKAAQLQGMPLEWLARTGMFLHRPVDYAGMYNYVNLVFTTLYP